MRSSAGRAKMCGMSRLWVLSIAALALGCATGEEVPEDGYGGAAGSVAGGGMAGLGGSGGSWASGGAGVGGSGTGGSGGSGGSGGTGAGGAGGSGASGGSGGTSGATGGTGGTGTGGSGTGGTGGTSCTATNACASATDLGVVSGDSNADTKQKSGSGSTWLKVRVTEDNSSILGQSLTLQVTLDVPTGSDYDLYAYLNTTSDTSPCGTSPAKKSDAGGIGSNEQLKLDWGDGIVGSGSDDSRTVVIEIRHKGGTCEQWSLIAAGNV